MRQTASAGFILYNTSTYPEGDFRPSLTADAELLRLLPGVTSLGVLGFFTGFADTLVSGDLNDTTKAKNYTAMLFW